MGLLRQAYSYLSDKMIVNDVLLIIINIKGYTWPSRRTPSERSLITLRMHFRISPVALLCPALILLVASGRICVAEDLSSINLWNAGIGGYVTYRIPGIGP